MFYFNTNQCIELDNRLRALGYKTVSEYPWFKSTGYVLNVPHANIITLFSNGKLEDIDPEFRKNLRKVLATNYESHVLDPITKKYETQMTQAIETWTYQYNIARLNNILDDGYDISFPNGVPMNINISITNTDGYGIIAEIQGAERAVKDFRDFGYRCYVEENSSYNPYICIIMKEF